VSGFQPDRDPPRPQERRVAWRAGIVNRGKTPLRSNPSLRAAFRDSHRHAINERHVRDSLNPGDVATTAAPVSLRGVLLGVESRLTTRPAARHTVPAQHVESVSPSV